MVLFSFRLDQFSCRLPADPSKRFPGYFDSFSIQHFFPVSGHKDQMDVHIENAMSSSSNLVVFLNRPKYNLSYADTQGIEIETEGQTRPAAIFPATGRVLPVRLEQTMRFLDKAPREAFDKKNPQRFPWVKKKGQGIDSCRYPQGFKLDGHRVFLPKRGWVRFINSREIGATGKKVREKSLLSSSLLGQGWLEFRRQLEDKLAGNGGWRHTCQKGQDLPGSPVQWVAPSCRQQQGPTRATALKPMLMPRWWWNPRSSGR